MRNIRKIKGRRKINQKENKMTSKTNEAVVGGSVDVAREKPSFLKRFYYLITNPWLYLFKGKIRW